jgi:riboflavin kinase/FMN adenylyltransferase
VRIHRSIADLAGSPAPRRGITLGVFDGVHGGHRRILADLIASGDRAGLEATLAITFDPHPLSLLRPDLAPRLITTVEERLGELVAAGLDEVLLLPFTRELAETDYDRFTAETLVGKLGLELLVVGYDFHLGRERSGTAESMAALGETLGFKVKVITPHYLDGRIVSSTHIRQSIAAGDMEAVRQALGRPYRLSGRVVSGRGLGRGLSFPTANLISPPPEKLLPPCGVYLAATEARGERRFGLLNLGWAPTLKGEFGAELHLLDFSGDLLGELLQVDFLQMFRPERKFPDEEALRAQIEADVGRARAILAGDGGGDGPHF